MIPEIKLSDNKKVYFASDFHLGVPSKADSDAREKRIVKWLDECKTDAAAIFLVGDIFDFWFEYKHTIPKGFSRLKGKLAELREKNIPIIFFIGNHDMWMFNYFPDEFGIPIIRENLSIKIGEKQFLIGHGDGLGPGDGVYKILKKVFANKLCQWLFARIHPNLGIGIAKLWSHSSRAANNKKEEKSFGEREWLVQYCKAEEAKNHHDFYIFGHRHLPMEFKIAENSKYINLGEWLNYNTYAVFNGEHTELKTFET